jgi:hypothetical protein
MISEKTPGMLKAASRGYQVHLTTKNGIGLTTTRRESVLTVVSVAGIMYFTES